MRDPRNEVVVCDITYFYLRKHPSLRQFQRKKHSFKPLCWNVNENCDVDVSIVRTSYQSKNTIASIWRENMLRRKSEDIFALNGGYCLFIRLELRALLIRELPA